MAQDITWKSYFSDDERYADIINGIGCGGKQLIAKDDLQELDTQTGFLRKPQFIRTIRTRTHRQKVIFRDMLRKAAFGVNFAIIGIENQETIDYSLPLRNMAYEVGDYEKQAVKIRREVRRNSKGLTNGEYLYGFKKDNKLKPVMTFILYSGLEEWDGPKTLHDLLDFTDIPEMLRERMPNYRINLVEIRKLKDTSVFRTDVRQVFDFIRCSEDDKALSELVKKDEYYKNMEEDAFDVVAHYTNATKLIESKNYYEREDGKIDMCTAITKLIADGREEGRSEGIAIGRTRGIDEKTRIIVHNMLSRNMSIQDICAIAECSEELVKEVSRGSLKKK
ncbi:MAG: hypothetical protein HDR03_06580 [Lachnospiraceae bacterium]|nr:hypothetical protein [Lachnospiraceae bacterium]